MIEMAPVDFPIHVHLDDAHAKYNNQYGRIFPNTETRLAHAQQLRERDGEPHFNRTWSVLASHWAETDDTARQLAWRLFNLQPAMARHRGQTVIRLSGFTPRDIRPASGRLPANIEIELGTLNPSLDTKRNDAVALRHQFWATNPAKLARDVRQFPFMDMRVGMLVTSHQTLSTDSEGELTVDPYTDFESAVTAFAGRVCVAADRGLYQAHSASRFYGLQFGNAKAYNLLNSIVETVGGQPQQQFKELVEAGDIRSDKPLTDLEFLTAA